MASRLWTTFVDWKAKGWGREVSTRTNLVLALFAATCLTIYLLLGCFGPGSDTSVRELVNVGPLLAFTLFFLLFATYSFVILEVSSWVEVIFTGVLSLLVKVLAAVVRYLRDKQVVKAVAERMAYHLQELQANVTQLFRDLVQHAVQLRPELAELARTHNFSDAPRWLVQAALALLALLPLFLFSLFRGKQPAKPFLKADEWLELPLTSVEVAVLQRSPSQEVSHDTRRFRFELPRGTPVLGLPTGKHITLRTWDADGKAIMRPYTPVTNDFHRGYVDFVIKLYPEGRMSKELAKLAPGQSLGFKGPKGRFLYEPNSKSAIGMIAGGSGITPMFQVLQAILRDEGDGTPLHLVFANRTERDILLRKEIDALAAKHPQQLHVHYVLDSAPEGWAGSTGYCTGPMLKEHLPAPGPEVLVLQCGPPPMVKAVDALLASLGYPESAVFKF